MKYEFHVGDYVEDVTGRTGYINSICQCKHCEERGFYEPRVIYNNGDCDYITIYECEKGFPSYKRIGQYEFTKQDSEIAPLDQFDGHTMWTTALGQCRLKINECVNAVNELRAAQRGGE